MAVVVVVVVVVVDDDVVVDDVVVVVAVDDDVVVVVDDVAGAVIADVMICRCYYCPRFLNDLGRKMTMLIMIKMMMMLL
jgi:hypothetical protein